MNVAMAARHDLQPTVLVLDHRPEELRSWLSGATQRRIELRRRTFGPLRLDEDGVLRTTAGGRTVVHLAADAPSELVARALAHLRGCSPEPIAVAFHDPAGGPPPAAHLRAVAGAGGTATADLTTCGWFDERGAWVSTGARVAHLAAAGTDRAWTLRLGGIVRGLVDLTDRPVAAAWLDEVVHGVTAGAPEGWSLLLRSTYVEELIATWSGTGSTSHAPR